MRKNFFSSFQPCVVFGSCFPLFEGRVEKFPRTSHVLTSTGRILESFLFLHQFCDFDHRLPLVQREELLLRLIILWWLF